MRGSFLPRCIANRKCRVLGVRIDHVPPSPDRSMNHNSDEAGGGYRSGVYEIRRLNRIQGTVVNLVDKVSFPECHAWTSPVRMTQLYMLSVTWGGECEGLSGVGTGGLGVFYRWLSRMPEAEIDNLSNSPSS